MVLQESPPIEKEVVHTPDGLRSRRDADEVRQPAMRAHGSPSSSRCWHPAVLARAAIPPDVERSLKESKYVYVQSERKSGAFGKRRRSGSSTRAAPVRRLAAHHVAREADQGGEAKGADRRRQDRRAVVRRHGRTLHDPALEERLMAAYARKYAEGWERFADKFRAGFKDGSRVLIAYTPAD